MRSLRHTPLEPLQADADPIIQSVTVNLNRIADGIDRLITLLENPSKAGLGGAAEPRYTRPPGDSGLSDERSMAVILGISPRTLARYRRDGRLPACWVRNGGRIWWRVAETREAWARGIA